jgi:hypothetical protein
MVVFSSQIAGAPRVIKQKTRRVHGGFRKEYFCYLVLELRLDTGHVPALTPLITPIGARAGATNGFGIVEFEIIVRRRCDISPFVSTRI